MIKRLNNEIIEYEENETLAFPIKKYLFGYLKSLTYLHEFEYQDSGIKISLSDIITNEVYTFICDNLNNNLLGEIENRYLIGSILMITVENIQKGKTVYVIDEKKYKHVYSSMVVSKIDVASLNQIVFMLLKEGFQEDKIIEIVNKIKSIQMTKLMRKLNSQRPKDCSF
jgi:hypothetical protein